ncbi:MAG: 1-acyl-sn-glycerol-3-phosphate acyltransferase [Clostridiaceae bacterium]|nr:1-acyl-sn-glycerol-3-phosphate acyltransferase [Clostridiaceae bacterium]
MQKIFGIIHFLFYGIYMFAFVMPKAKKLDKENRLEEKRALTNAISKKWAGILINSTGSNIDVTGLEHVPQEGPVLFISNHQGYFDIPILLHCLPKSLGFLAKIELKKWPIISKWMPIIECVFIDRKDIRQSLKAIKATTENLKSGQSMVIFPEGTRSKSSEIDAFKPGSLKPAQKANVPIVPITIENTYKILEANNDRNLSATNVKVTIHPSIDPNKETDEKSGDMMVRIHEIIKSGLNSKKNYS